MASPKINLGTTPNYGSCDTPLIASKPYFPTLYVSRNEDDKDLQGLPSKGKAVVEYRVRSRTVSEDSDGKKRASADIEIQSIEPLGKKLAELSARIDGHFHEFYTIGDFNAATSGAATGAMVGAIRGRKKAIEEGETGWKKAGRIVKQAVLGGVAVGALTPIARRAGDGMGKALGKAVTSRRAKHLSAMIDTHLNEFAGEAVSEDPRPRDPMGQFTAGQTQGLDPMTMKQAYKKKRTPSLARIGALAGGRF